MKSTNWVINIRRQSFAAVCLLSLLIFNSAFGTNAADKLSQEPSALNNEIDFDSSLMPSPEQVIAADTPTSPKPKARKATLSDPRGFSSTPYADTKTGQSEEKPFTAKPESEQRERLRPELHGAPTKPWYRKFYVRFDRGEDTPKTGKGITFKRNAMLSGGLGYRFNDVFRADLNLQSRKFKTSRTSAVNSVVQQAVFLNGYVQLMESGYLMPYLTAGVGYVTNKVKDMTTKEPTTISIVNQLFGKRLDNAGWNLGVGALLLPWRLVKIDVGYKFLDFGLFKGYNVQIVNGVTTGQGELKRPLRAHEFLVGIMLNL